MVRIKYFKTVLSVRSNSNSILQKSDHIKYSTNSERYVQMDPSYL